MKKILSTILCSMMVFAVCAAFTGCGEKRYDVAIKIGCSQWIYPTTPGVGHPHRGILLEEYIFTPDIDEMHIEREYDGNEYVYYIIGYNLPDHPKWSDEWLSPDTEGWNVFISSLSYGDYDAWLCKVENVSDKGTYLYKAEASSGSTLWNRRVIRLYITVK